MELQTALNSIAKDVFRKQADYDYISARANYRMRLRQQFLWSGQQAIEKYLKAILLFNGKSARFYRNPESGKKEQFRHDLDALLREAGAIEDFKIEISAEDRSFLSYLSKQGGLNRYLTVPSYNTSDALMRLDQLVWRLRRYCQYIPDRGIGCREEVPGMKASYIRAITRPENELHPHNFNLISGELESILKRSSKDPARKALVWANFWFGKKHRKTVTYSAFSSSETPPNERDWWDIDPKTFSEYVKF